jgi:hypothetical protein
MNTPPTVSGGGVLNARNEWAGAEMWCYWTALVDFTFEVLTRPNFSLMISKVRLMYGLVKGVSPCRNRSGSRSSPTTWKLAQSSSGDNLLGIFLTWMNRRSGPSLRNVLSTLIPTGVKRKVWESSRSPVSGVPIFRKHLSVFSMMSAWMSNLVPLGYNQWIRNQRLIILYHCNHISQR